MNQRKLDKQKLRKNLNRLMEKTFLSLIEGGKMEETDSSFTYHNNGECLFFYAKGSRFLDAWRINNVFREVYNISSTKAIHFSKMMVIKHFKLDIK